MLNNNNQRWTIWQEAGRTLDYHVFAQACLAQGVEPLTCMRFAHLAGQALVGAATLPNLEPLDAFRMLPESSWSMDDRYIAKPVHPTPEELFGPSCCGGGAIR